MENRIRSIDAFRALTMLLMVWVNDFWSLSNVPSWLLHVSADTDGMGFSDIIFPVFLFIVGLSIPFALQARAQRGENLLQVCKHIAARSAALILMGVLMVNLENYDTEAALLPKMAWQLTMVAAFILIWNSYPKSDSWKTKARALRAFGWALIVVLLYTFRSAPANGYNWIEPHWWGILGLIGWSYLICSLYTLFASQNIASVLVGWLALSLFNIAWLAGWLDALAPLKDYVWIVGDGSLPALTLCGCLLSLIYLHYRGRASLARFYACAVSIGCACILVGFLLRPLGGISKIHATPSWTQICAGIAILSFTAIYWIVDQQRLKAWYTIIAPAGSATLTCYLLPYLAYPLLELAGLSLPEVATSGLLGLMKSLAFAFAIVWATGGLNRCGVKLGV
ncbi:DUF5009 domain-containing protein [Pelagicoccus sp. NFK12]|uniref:DUF5009 domain-containing protein n=1 Tax=Pelagicoccus enzymogenes TaxID=2773457 RepID=A0A927F8N5_9BACT|nr:DUF5009 domain-containing protein [Pelagicoccus enzymogenes]MBD5779884.1 DUF5009 domain-containing protein [Pelagicoccus enzymogenes]